MRLADEIEFWIPFVFIKEAIYMTEVWRIIGFKMTDKSKKPPSKIKIGRINICGDEYMGEEDYESCWENLYFYPPQMCFKIGENSKSSQRIYDLFLHENYVDALEWDMDKVKNWRYLMFGGDVREYNSYYYTQLNLLKF